MQNPNLFQNQSVINSVGGNVCAWMQDRERDHRERYVAYEYNDANVMNDEEETDEVI